MDPTAVNIWTSESPPPRTTPFYLLPEQLKRHPENMRRYYPSEEVAEIAASLRENNGNYQALLVLAPEKDKPDRRYTVVDGNMRLAGGRYLNDDCPPLKCELINADQAHQRLIMAVTSKNHYPKDPISEALHYQRMHQEDGLPIRHIARVLGVSAEKVTSRLRLLALDPEIQDLIAEGLLSKDKRVANALLDIQDASARVSLVCKLVKSPQSITSILAACKSLKRRLETRANASDASYTPALELASDHSQLPPADHKVAPQPLRNAARRMCQACENNMLDGQPFNEEPAWQLLGHAANVTCGPCELRGFPQICRDCPAVKLLVGTMQAMESYEDA